MKNHHCTTILVSSFLPSGVKHGKHALTSMKCSHDANFSRGVPSQPCLMESSELDPSTLCHSAGIIIPSTAEGRGKTAGFKLRWGQNETYSP